MAPAFGGGAYYWVLESKIYFPCYNIGIQNIASVLNSGQSVFDCRLTGRAVAHSMGDACKTISTQDASVAVITYNNKGVSRSHHQYGACQPLSVKVDYFKL